MTVLSFVVKIENEKVSWVNSNINLVEHSSAIDPEVLNRRHQGHPWFLVGGETKGRSEPPVCPAYRWHGSKLNAGFQSSAGALCAQ